MVISWGEPDNPNGVIIGYIIRYGEEEGGFTARRTVDASTTKLEFAQDLSEYIHHLTCELESFMLC